MKDSPEPTSSVKVREPFIRVAISLAGLVAVSTNRRHVILKSAVISFGLCCSPLTMSMAEEKQSPLVLTEVVSRSIASNPMLKAAAAKWAAAKERSPQVKAWDDPMVGVDVERMGTLQFNEISDTEWMISQSLPLSGKNLSRARAADADALVAYEEVRRLRLEITAKAKVAYLRLANGHGQIAINRQNRALLEQVLAVGNAKLAVGQSAQIDVLVVEIDIQRLDIERETLEQALSEQQTALNVLMNRPAGSPLGHPSPLVFRPMPVASVQLETRLLALRPGIAAAMHRLKAEEARLQLAHREWIPDPQVRVEARRFRGSRDTITEYDTGIFFSVPWVNPRKYSAGVREGQQMVEAMRQEIESERASALGMLRDQLRRIGVYRRQYELSRDRLLPLARKSAETLQISYQTDSATFVELLTVQRLLREAQATTLTQLTEYLSALAELDAIVGSETQDSSSAKAIKVPSRKKP